MTNAQKKFLKYALLPGFISRIFAFFTSGFGFSAYLIAGIYQSVRLLPDNHPYLNPDNIGQYGIRHVIGAAANNLKFKAEHIDQIIVFFLLLTGLIILITQFILLIIAMMAYQPAFADEATATVRFFTRDSGRNLQDIAMILMDRVFGVSGIFESCVSILSKPCKDLNDFTTSNPGQFPTAFHIAFRQLLSFYSMGMFVIGAFIIIYFTSVIISETAANGTPFGQRYNKTWFPVRIILFFALLTPLGGTIEENPHTGLNSAQIITLWVAKSGSNFASNGWDIFTNNLIQAQTNGRQKLVAEANIPELNQLVQFIFIAKTCQITEMQKKKEYAKQQLHGPNGIQPYIVRSRALFQEDDGMEDAALLHSFGYDQALKHSNKESIFIRFGSQITTNDNTAYKESKIGNGENIPTQPRHQRAMGNVFPVCGDIKLDVSSIDRPELSSYKIQKAYYNRIVKLWDDPTINAHAKCLAEHQIGCFAKPNKEFIDTILESVRSNFQTEIGQLLKEQVKQGGPDNITENLQAKGWAGAAIWYNQIAELNGKITGALLNLPQVVKYPFIMEYIAGQKKREEENINEEDLYKPSLQNNKDITYDHPADKQIAPILYKSHRIWEFESAKAAGVRVGQNPFLDAINFIFGTNGIYNIMENPDINPLAQLSTLGKGMMEASIRNIAGGITGNIAGTVFKGNLAADAMSMVASFFQSVGYMSLTISFTLYYILPVMPFIYFLFAVSGWIKGIFEAMVAMPLWALAHISRWDGEGIAGPGANNGYFLLFEIFLRPIMILLGLLVSISAFSALVMVLNEIFTLVIENVGGFDQEAQAANGFEGVQNLLRGPVDELFYTMVYTVICYMIGLSAFKLIDSVPNEILRWMGFAVKTFQDDMKNAAEQLSGMSYKGTTYSSNKLAGSTLSGSQLGVLIG